MFFPRCFFLICWAAFLPSTTGLRGLQPASSADKQEQESTQAKFEAIATAIDKYESGKERISMLQRELATRQREIAGSQRSILTLENQLKLMPNDPETLVKLVEKQTGLSAEEQNKKVYEELLSNAELSHAKLTDELALIGSNDLQMLGEQLAQSLGAFGAEHKSTQRLKRTIERLQKISADLKTQGPISVAGLTVRRNLMLFSQAIEQIDRSAAGLAPPLDSAWKGAAADHMQLVEKVHELEKLAEEYGKKLAEADQARVWKSSGSKMLVTEGNVEDGGNVQLRIEDAESQIGLRRELAQVRLQALLAARTAAEETEQQSAADHAARMDQMESRLSRIETLLEKIAEGKKPDGSVIKN